VLAAVTEVLSPELQEQLRALVARASALVRGSAHGAHRSRDLGGGSEFSEYKAYGPGDDLRALDWKVLARTDRHVVKQFESDRRTDVQLLLDRSASMAFGTTDDRDRTPWGAPWPGTKWEAARTLALALAFVFLRQGDRVGLTVVDGGAQTPLPARGGIRQLAVLARTIVDRAPVGAAGLGAAAESLLVRSPRALTVLLSDLLDEGEADLDRLAVHAARGREAWVVHVVDPAEIEFPYDEPTRFVDLEGGDELGLNPRELARSYREEFAAHLEQRQRRCLDVGVHYLRLVTDQPLDEVLAGFLRSTSWA
jgi:uncharacterized protein (DUF58 family)